jgi:hypothetical protein
MKTTTDTTEERIPDGSKLYQGWRNRQTFLVAVHILNDRAQLALHFAYAGGVLATVEARDGFTHQEEARLELAKQLKSVWTPDEMPISPAGTSGLSPAGYSIFCDLLSSALERVCWLEIAKYLIEAVQEDMT